MATIPQIRPRFRVTIPSVLSSFCLIAAVQFLVSALKQLLMPTADALFNWVIRKGNFNLFLLHPQSISWPLVLNELTSAMFWAILSFILAYWIHPGVSKQPRSAFE